VRLSGSSDRSDGPPLDGSSPAGSTLDGLAVSLPARARALRQNRWDHVVASDPGGARLVSALEAALSVSVTISLVYGFSQLAHPLWISAPPSHALPAFEAARLAGQHHGVTELSMLIGGIVALMSTLVNGPTPRNRAVTIVGLPIPFLAMFALGIELVGHHTLGLFVFTLVVASGHTHASSCLGSALEHLSTGTSCSSAIYSASWPVGS
jgi:hypothetical protein